MCVKVIIKDSGICEGVSTRDDSFCLLHFQKFFTTWYNTTSYDIWFKLINHKKHKSRNNTLATSEKGSDILQIGDENNTCCCEWKVNKDLIETTNERITK